MAAKATAIFDGDDSRLMAAVKRIDKSLLATQAKFAKSVSPPRAGSPRRPPRLSFFPVRGLQIGSTGPLLLQPGDVSRGAILAFAALRLFGIAAMCYGLWQIATGKRSKWIIYFLVGLVIALVLAAFFIRGRE